MILLYILTCVYIFLGIIFTVFIEDADESSEDKLKDRLVQFIYQIFIYIILWPYFLIIDTIKKEN